MSWWPGRDASLSRQAIRSWLAPAPSQVTISRRRYFGGSAAIASPKTLMWSAAVLDPADQWMQSEPFEIRLGALLIGMARHDCRVQPQPGHARQRLVRHRDAGQRAVAGLDGRPR